MRQIGKGFAGAFKLCSTLNLPRLTKTAYKNQEAKLLKVVQEVAEESMIKAATEIVEKQQNLSSYIVKCDISVDGTWQRRGYTSMNGCVAAISVDTVGDQVQENIIPIIHQRFPSAEVRENNPNIQHAETAEDISKDLNMELGSSSVSEVLSTDAAVPNVSLYSAKVTDSETRSLPVPERRFPRRSGRIR
ncbi:uncharacterized protein TNCV_4146551 [Trichonephila clavipes]|nr:uncharacterized protein TNCV_4146551 [Trichonephila clavipes]